MERSLKDENDSSEIASTKKRTCLHSTGVYILKRIPVLYWFPMYKWKEDFLYDVIAGLSMACISVPQGLAFSVLANVDLIYGLNTACFSAFVYSLFGTAKISSFGPVAVGSMLVGEAVTVHDFENENFTKGQFVAALTICIGICYIVAFILRLGVLTIVFRKPFVCGFISACVLHIVTKYLKLIFGISLKAHHGYFNFYYNLINLVSNLGKTNVPTLIISIVCILIFLLNIFVFSPFLSKRTRFVLPIETIVMGGTIILSYIFTFKDMGVPVVGTVPTGFPEVIFPNGEAFLPAMPQSIAIALINYATTSSMTILFNEDLDPDQDVLAMGLTNLICGNLQCITVGNSMMRTVIAATTGLKTLLATMTSSVFLLFVILFAGPIFEPLPTAVLGCIILVAATKLLVKRILDVRKFYKSYDDMLIFSATLFCTVVFDLVIGLIVGTALSLRVILSEFSDAEKLKKKLLEEEKKLAEEEKVEEENLLPKIKISS